MKIQTKKLLKSVVSLALCLSMVLCTPLTAFAEETANTTTKPIVYVSIGDSMTNGYCLDGYDGTSGAINYGVDTYSNKFAAYLAGYTGKIANDQVIFTGTNGTVDHRQLALSGMRAQDIQWVLELDYANDTLMQTVFNSDYDDSIGFNQTTWYNTWGFNGDYRTWADFCDYDFRYADAAARILKMYHGGNGTGYFTSSYATDSYVTAATNGISANPYYPEGRDQVNAIGGYEFLQIATEFYQESIKDADIISIAVGNTNFGTHMLSSVLNVVMYNDTSFKGTYNLDKIREIAYSDEYVTSKVNTILNSQSYADMMAMCKSLASGNTNKEAEIAYIVEYCMIAYINGYIGMLDAILDVNPDVEIIQIPLMNAYEEQGGTITEGTLGELAEVIYIPVNELLESLLPDYIEKHNEAKFYLSEDVYVSCMVDVFGDDFYKDENGSFVTYPGPLTGNEGYTANTESLVRDRFVEEIVCGDLLFNAMSMKKLNSQENIHNFLYGGKVLNTSGAEAYTGCGAANYDLMTSAQKAAYAATNATAAKEYALYLAFECALILSGTENVTMEALANLSNIATAFGDFYPRALTAINSASVNYYDDVAPVIAAGSNGQLSENNVMTIMNAYTSGEEALAMVSYDIAAEKANAKISEIMGSDGSLSITLSGSDVYNLCNDQDGYTSAVCKLIATKSNGQLTSNQVQTLAASENGVWTVAGEISGEDASFIKMAYDRGYLNADQKAQIDLLFKVRQGTRAFIAYESDLKGGVVALQAAIPTVVENASNLAYLLAIPNAMSSALYNDSNMQGGLCMNARCLLGTGAGGHPSIAGHQSLYDAMLGTFNQEIEYEWSEDYSTCTASRGEYATETVNSTSETTKPADCKNVGEITYTAVFETYWAATQTATKEIPVTDHDYSKFTDPAWTWTDDYKASAVFTCPVCEKTIDVTNDVTVSGETVTEADCRNEGKYTYTATVKFNGKDYSSTKDKVLEKLEHNYGEDGTCENILVNGTVCGEYNLEKYGTCEKTVTAELSSGSTLTMLLDGNNTGKFTFTETASGWTIANAEGKYLASDANGNLVLSDSAYSWNYTDGKFSTVVKVPGTNWYEQLLGITKDATYYITYSNGSVAVATSGSAVTFSTTQDGGYHSFGNVNVVAPTCTEEGYTERTCSVCEKSFKTNAVAELGHSYVDTVVAPKCGVEGYTEHKCTCGDSYVDTKVPALEHDFSGENDTCIYCGKSDVAVYGECEYKVEASLSDGTYTLSLGGTEVGTYTFASVSGGYAIKGADGKYLALDSNGNVVSSDSAYAWNYSNGQFSGTVSKAGTSWLDKLLGRNTSTTYYLVASGSSVASSTSGATAKFYTEGKAETHTLEENYVEPTCGVNGYTEYTCTVCGDTFTKEDKNTALSHNYTVTGTVAVTCTTDGYSVYTCSKCGDTYNADFVTAIGSHNFGEDGTCQNILPGGICGEPDEPECKYDKEHTLSSGNTYELVLGGKSVGNYTFTSVDSGYSIMNSEGKYLALDGSNLVLSDSAYAWTYSNGIFSSSSAASTGNSWLDLILSGRKTTYYLASSGNSVTVSTSTSSSTAKFVAEVTGEHNYSNPKPVNGNHVSVCGNCDYEKIEVCKDDNCALCNSSVTVTVNVQKGSANWLEALLGSSSKNTATITAVAEGTEVSTVEYSLDGKTWTKGTSFTSKTAITSFKIRVTATNGLVYNYVYNNGSVNPV